MRGEKPFQTVKPKARIVSGAISLHAATISYSQDIWAMQQLLLLQLWAINSRTEQFRCGLTSCEPALKQEFQNYVLFLTLRFEVSEN
jgi:hypothetical protein